MADEGDGCAACAQANLVSGKLPMAVLLPRGQVRESSIGVKVWHSTAA